MLWSDKLVRLAKKIGCTYIRIPHPCEITTVKMQSFLCRHYILDRIGHMTNSLIFQIIRSTVGQVQVTNCAKDYQILPTNKHVRTAKKISCTDISIYPSMWIQVSENVLFIFIVMHPSTDDHMTNCIHPSNHLFSTLVKL